MSFKGRDNLIKDIKKTVLAVSIIIFSIIFIQRMIQDPSQAKKDFETELGIERVSQSASSTVPDKDTGESGKMEAFARENQTVPLNRQVFDNEPGIVSQEPENVFEDRSSALEDERAVEAPVIPEEVIVKLSDNNIDVPEFARDHGLEIISISKNNIHAKLSETGSLSRGINGLMEDDRVSYAEPNYIYRASYIPNDIYYNNNWPGLDVGKQWGPQKIGAPKAWDVTTGTSSSIVAVIDTGVDYNHPELAARVINGPDYSNSDSDPMDDNGHGSHVAGIIAANGDNGIGVAGMSWNSRILAIKALNNTGNGYLIDVANSIIYATDNGADVINLSLAGPNYSQTLQDAIAYAHSKGVVVIAAAGNSASPIYGNPMNYPAGLNNVIGVGATDQNDLWAHFSSYNSSVDISAPGVDISSLHTTYLGYAYLIESGTSMSAPFVAGVASLINSVRPEWSPDQIESRLIETSTDLGPIGRDDYYGWGRLDAYKALFKTPDLLEILSVSPTGSIDPQLGPVIVDYELIGASETYMSVLNGRDEVIERIGPEAATIGLNSISWDGRDSQGNIVDPGWYRLDIYAKTAYGAINKSVLVEVDYGQPLTLGSSTVSQSPFDPQFAETVTISTYLQKESLLGMVIYNSNREQVMVFPLNRRTGIGTASFVWDGRDSLGNLVPNGIYDYFIIGIDSGGNSSVVDGSVSVQNP